MTHRSVAALIAVAGCGLGLWAFQASKSSQEQKPVPSYYKSAEAAKPYPKTMPPERYPKQSQQEAYRLAREIPGVLAQQPCYCYCDRSGHGSLLHCHRDDHSAGWMICLKEVLLAGKMHKQGKKPAEIRAAIIRGDWQQIELK